MGLILDSSILVAFERRRFDLERLLTDHLSPAIAAVTAAELRIGVERADSPQRRARREEFVEGIFVQMPIAPFDLPQARLFAIHFADLASRGERIGDRDLQIAVTALSLSYGGYAQYGRVSASRRFKPRRCHAVQDVTGRTPA